MYLHDISIFVKFLPVTALPKVGTMEFSTKQVYVPASDRSMLVKLSMPLWDTTLPSHLYDACACALVEPEHFNEKLVPLITVNWGLVRANWEPVDVI